MTARSGMPMRAKDVRTRNAEGGMRKGDGRGARSAATAGGPGTSVPDTRASTGDPPAGQPTAAHTIEAEVAEGLEEIARDEIRARLGGRAALYRLAGDRPERGVVRFDYRGELRELLELRTVLAAHLVRHFPVPRPRALLGDEHFRALLAQLALVRALLPPDAYRTLYLSAAGSESSVLTRLKEELARATGLAPSAPEGDLQLRLRRAAHHTAGWEALVRLSPRPLGARPWRVCNLEGSLNATVARAMAIIGRPRPGDAYLNLACGSGTLLVERLLTAPARRAIGCDTSAAALDCARANLAAAGLPLEGRNAVELWAWDARATPLPERSVDALAADLPFGHLVGSHAENLELYPAILREAARLARPGAPFVLITHELRLTEGLLAGSADWTVEEVLRVGLGGLYPRIFTLRRRGD